MSASVFLRLPFFVSMFFCFVSFAGCGSGVPNLVPVTGSVTVDGKPAKRATLIFHPTDKEVKLIPTATTDDDGKFKLVTNAKEGIPIGSYDITVFYPDSDLRSSDVVEKLQGVTTTSPDLLGGKYAKKGATGLKADITSSTKELPPLQLSK